FMMIRPQKKRDNELKEMQNSLEVGDEIVTGGGIVGIVVSTGEDTVVIETGGARHKLRIKTWAITENVTAQERIKSAKASTAKKKENALASAGVVEDEPEKKPKKKKKESEEE
ncbi:MAG: preprotein translocase subunit YajC, partial [Ruminococcus sp.]|nr:preprotein translocase subunit YajC [Ruminococcus sp.]